MLSRRSFVKQIAMAPVVYRPSALSVWRSQEVSESAGAERELPPGAFHYDPQYRAHSPVEDLLGLVRPGSDEFLTEMYAAQLEAVLTAWVGGLERDNFPGLLQHFSPELEASSLTPLRETLLRDRQGVACSTRTFGTARSTTPKAFADGWQHSIGSGANVNSAEFQIKSLEAVDGALTRLRTSVRYSLHIRNPDSSREQRVGVWKIVWSAVKVDPSGSDWRVVRLEAGKESRTVVRGAGFTDVTRNALGREASYTQQLCKGTDYWRSVLDGACGIDVYGNNGIAVGDFNKDGLDGIYVSQPAGLPNRLYRSRGDGTLEDVTDKAGVGVLDNTACALFADFRNIGLQDLLVVCGSGPLLFLNGGDGTFKLKQNAFRFARPPQGTFTHAAVADYDRDGRLDIYFCLYSYYLGLDQYHYPTPYFDARNGPPNFLMANQGDGTFIDRTEAAGLNVENDRYSFACAWHENGDRQPDLYVVNDFGRNNLYRSKGDGTFAAVSAAAHVQDVGAGMSASWADYNNTGHAGLYVANMWSAAGQRISHLPAFHPGSTPAIRELYQRHAGGNALYRSEVDGTFTNVSEDAGVEMGRWAWGSDFFDFDRDGCADLYVTNGYITAPDTAGAPSTELSSFFWRQVVGRSPDDATPSLAYEHGWNALNELIRTDHSWSGHERNVLFVNNGDGTFLEASGPLGMDFLEDGRSFALADLDGDGRLEVLLKNRNGPQLRILHNSMEQLGDGIAFRLRGTDSNRDAIGTTITLRCGKLTQTRSLQAGSGFLSQHTKELFFGLGSGTDAVHAVVRWPSGKSQQFADLPRNSRIKLVEGEGTHTAVAFRSSAKAYTENPGNPDEVRRSLSQQTIPTVHATWLLDPLKAPAFTLPDRSGAPVALESFRGRHVLLHLWSSVASGWQEQLQALDTVAAAQVTVVALNLDQTAVQSTLRIPSLRLTTLNATPDAGGMYNIIFRYLFDRRANLPLPTSFLIDPAGMIVRVYQGPVVPEALLDDFRNIPTSLADRVRLALPFAGNLFQGSFARNDFTYGVAMFQHGYLDQAAVSFEEVIAARPDNAEAHYNLGTLSLRRNDFTRAREQLSRAIALKPDYPEAWNNLGMMAAKEGQTQQAINGFQKSLALRPAYATAMLNLGNLYRHQGKFTEAQSYLTRSLALQPDDPEINYSLGMLFAQQSQFSSAASYLERAVALRPDYPEALNNLGVLYIRQGDSAKAEQQFLTCLRLSPSYEGTYLNLGRLYFSEGDKTKARKVINDLLKLDPESQAGRQALQALGTE